MPSSRPRALNTPGPFLGSAVEFKVMDVADVGELHETFDLVLFLGVYYHLRDPIQAFRVLFDRLRPGGQLVLEGLVLPDGNGSCRLAAMRRGQLPDRSRRGERPGHSRARIPPSLLDPG